MINFCCSLILLVRFINIISAETHMYVGLLKISTATGVVLLASSGFSLYPVIGLLCRFKSHNYFTLCHFFFYRL